MGTSWPPGKPDIDGGGGDEHDEAPPPDVEAKDTTLVPDADAEAFEPRALAPVTRTGPEAGEGPAEPVYLIARKGGEGPAEL